MKLATRYGLVKIDPALKEDKNNPSYLRILNKGLSLSPEYRKVVRVLITKFIPFA